MIKQNENKATIKSVLNGAEIEYDDLLGNEKAFDLHWRDLYNKSKICLFIVDGRYEMFIYTEEREIENKIVFDCINQIPSTYWYLIKMCIHKKYISRETVEKHSKLIEL